jgi:tetraacyldisaccharide 4'-kinase
MRAPEFWHHPESPTAALLSPLGALYDAAGRLRASLTHPTKLARPVICVGNLTAGGAGKTPVALAIAAWLKTRGHEPHFLTRGYGGRLTGPFRVDPERHSFRDAGDEPHLLAEAAPTWVAPDRRKGAAMAIAEGAELIIMDDGLQNPTLAKDLGLLVLDGGYGFGNGRVIPAGPLRETIAHGLARAQAAVVVGADEHQLGEALAARLPVLAARLEPDHAARALAGKRVLAFAGIGRPGKFSETLAALGAILIRFEAFPDHHPYEADEIMQLVEEAAACGAELVTTAKDRVRLPPEARPMVTTVRVRLVWDDEAQLERLLRPCLDSHG